MVGFNEIIVGLGKMSTSEKAGVGGVGRGVGGFEDKVLADVYQAFFLLGEFAPEKKSDVLSFVGKGFDGGVGQFFPAKITMRSWGIGANGKNGVEQ